jgi:hypothetical protein
VTNQRLRGALLNAGLTPAALADAVQVDVKSVMRWIAEERIPYPVTRVKVAHVLHQEATFLWPALIQDGEACTVAATEIERVWPTRSSISSETWHALFSKATQQFDILVYAGAFLIEALDLADVLKWKVSNGARVRVLVGDPQSEAVGIRAAELSLEWLPQRCNSTLNYLRQVNGIGVRPHGASHYASLFRFDDLLLANTHAYGIWACHSPVLQLHRSSSGMLFDFYASSFDNAWRRSGSIQPALGP